jgi:methionyl-tRNA synthetase
MYVWVDALTNYLTGLGFPDEGGDVSKWWPADLHLIGKDIVRFHAVYWPAFLMSAGLPLPKQIFGHGFLLNRGQKESKSLGNVTDPMTLSEQFGVDTLRYFLMREVAFGQDGSYSPEAIVTRVNAELANSFGNLAQRTLSMIFKNMSGELRTGHEVAEADMALSDAVAVAITGLRRAFLDLDFSDGLDAWMRAVFACNQYVDEQAPWTLRKTDPARMEAVLMTLLRCVRSLAIAVRPVVPTAIDKLLDQMGVAAGTRDYAALADATWLEDLAATGFTISQPVGVFPRLELPAAQEADA